MQEYKRKNPSILFWIMFVILSGTLLFTIIYIDRKERDIIAEKYWVYLAKDQAPVVKPTYRVSLSEIYVKSMQKKISEFDAWDFKGKTKEETLKFMQDFKSGILNLRVTPEWQAVHLDLVITLDLLNTAVQNVNTTDFDLYKTKLDNIFNNF